MSETHDHNLIDETTERAISTRLGKLRSMPVDMTRVRDAVAREVPRDTKLVRSRPEWFGSLRAVAAVVLVAVIATVALVLATAGRPALASAEVMARIHASMASEAQVVSSLDEAERVLKQQWPDQPGLPSDLPADEQAMTCCIHKLDGKRMTCLTMDLSGQRVSVAIGKADDFKIPAGSRRTINGHEYVIESAKGINMVMTKRDGRWVCVMSPLSVDELVNFTERVVW